MSGLLVFRWLVPVFALAIAATVWVVGGPMAAGLCLIAFLLGVVTCELHHMRWTPVEDAAASASSDSAFLALVAAGAQAAPTEAPSAPAGPPPPPKRNFRLTRNSLAIGSGEIRLELVERLRLHADAADQRLRKADPPAVAEAVPAPAPEPVLELEPAMVDRPTPPQPAAKPAASAPLSTRPQGPPPPRVTVLAAPGPDRKRASSEAFRSSYLQRGPR